MQYQRTCLSREVPSRSEEDRGRNTRHYCCCWTFSNNSAVVATVTILFDLSSRSNYICLEGNMSRSSLGQGS